MPIRWTLVPDARLDGAVSPRHLHALACTLVEDSESAHTAQLKPFSAAAPADPEHGRVLEVSWLDDAAPPEVPARVVNGGLHLASRPFRPAEVRHEHTPYAALADSAPAQWVRVDFASPTYINRAGRQIPLPDPELLLGGLVQRWRAFSPIPLGEEEVQALLGTVRITRHQVRTEAVRFGNAHRVGFTGTATFGVPSVATATSGRLLTALWRFAEFSGVGALTTHGLGRVRVRAASERDR